MIVLGKREHPIAPFIECDSCRARYEMHTWATWDAQKRQQEIVASGYVVVGDQHRCPKCVVPT
jgi:hypothetical protein